ncbi:hypothetical protein F4680DRAFT_438045 [Xylaria scruposa]|nr:hypothetical protein F4680DRAFT_438045 [Xylaria scruposa]
MASLMSVPSRDLLPPTGAITQDILTKKRDVLLKEHVARGLPVNDKKTAKVLRTERIMFELRVPQHIQATMIGKLNAVDMGETKCKVQTLRDYLAAAGEPVDPSALKITCITAIFQYWARSPDLNNVSPIEIDKRCGEPAPERTASLSPKHVLLPASPSVPPNLSPRANDATERGAGGVEGIDGRRDTDSTKSAVEQQSVRLSPGHAQSMNYPRLSMSPA